MLQIPTSVRSVTEAAKDSYPSSANRSPAFSERIHVNKTEHENPMRKMISVNNSV